MEQPKQALARYPSLQLFCGLGAALLGGTAFVGWLTGVRALASIGFAYMPMDPNTALAFVALGVAITLLVRAPLPRWALEAARLAAGGVAILASLRLCEFFPGVALHTDRWFFAAPPETFGQAPVGWMAYQTAITLLLGSAAILLLTSANRRSR